MPDDVAQTHTRSVQLRIIEVLSYAVIGTMMALTFALMFVQPNQENRELLASLKDSWIAISMLVIGYFFGTSASSATKDLRPTSTTKETP